MNPYDEAPLSESRRAWLRKTAWTAGAAALGGAWLGMPGSPAVAQTPQAGLKPLKLSWNAGAICTAPVAVAVKQGFSSGTACRWNS
jgi:NitT/TauT family transport system substrate-binding protein